MSNVQCELCPRGCVIPPDGRGDCRVRYNRNGELISLVYGKPCAVHVDPVEKKPMNHFLPGSTAFSIATAGCNLHCKFCQNWEISQRSPEETRNYDMPPESVIYEAKQAASKSIAYTYNDPVVFYEYVMDCSKLARKHGLNNIWVTAGYINQTPLLEACKLMDGANVDLKGDDKYYREIVSGTVKPVQDTIVTMVKEGVIVEITNLIVPTLNDKTEDYKKFVSWVLDAVGPDIPIHFSRFTPMYKLTHLYPTPAETLFAAAELASKMGAHYVYVGNLPPNEWENTKCPGCKKVIIKRRGYRVLENHVGPNGQCDFCKTKIYGKWI